MLTYEEAKKVGVSQCINDFGTDFISNEAETLMAVYAVSAKEKKMFCCVAADTKSHNGEPDTIPVKLKNDQTLFLPDKAIWPYRISLLVSLEDGSVEYLESIVPEKKEDAATKEENGE